MVGPLIAPYALALNHPCVDENTRVAHAAMETCLLFERHDPPRLRGRAGTADACPGAGRLTRAALTDWLEHHVSSVTPSPLFTAVVRARACGDLRAWIDRLDLRLIGLPATALCFRFGAPHTSAASA